MSHKQKRTFSKEFKADAVRMFREGSARLSEVARQLGVNKSVLYTWVRQAERTAAAKEKGGVDAAEHERLRRENEQLRMERDFLKKAAAFFAKNQS
jgi:transposase